MAEHSQNGNPSPANGPLTHKPPANGDSSPPPVPGWLLRNPWLTPLLPFVVFMVCGMFEPTPEKPFELGTLVIDYSAYPLVYTAKILFTMAAIAAVAPGYRQYPFRLTPLAPLVGTVGVLLWIGICKLQLEPALLAPLRLEWLVDLGRRSAFNPFEQWPDDRLWALGFLGVRFWGLVVVVPIIEEFFIRAFVMRFVIDADWPKIPFGTLTPTAIAAATLLGVLLHPAEMFAAAAWFSLVTWLMFKTRSIGDCVVAHAVTNLLLGAWVLASGDWYFL